MNNRNATAFLEFPSLARHENKFSRGLARKYKRCHAEILNNMSMYEAIKNQGNQFGFEPMIENSGQWRKFGKFIVAGMGGSHLAADLLKIWNPKIDLIVHSDYGLPALAQGELKQRFIIAVSYSGNTEEIIDSYQKAKENGLEVGAISIGGKLLEFAKNNGAPYIKIPDTGIQPRSAVGFMFKALLKMMGEEKALREAGILGKSLHPEDYEDAGKILAQRIKGFVPIIYSSGKNAAIASNWKVRFNETAKIPAFYNVFPELNHNEMTGFDPVRSRSPKETADALAHRTSNGADIKEARKKLNELFFFIILKDPDDPPKIKKRMETTQRIYRQKGLAVETVEISGKTVFQKIFSSLAIADWAAYYTGEGYGVETEQVPMVEEFKGLLQNFKP